MSTEPTHDDVMDFFGVCPECGNCDGCVNVGRNHWFYCAEHRTKWWVGSNLFSYWREQTREEQIGIYEKVGLGEFGEVWPSRRGGADGGR